MEALRSLYVLIQLRDELSAKLAVVNKLVDQTKQKLQEIAGPKTLSLQTAFETKPEAIAGFFRQVDLEVKRSAGVIGSIGAAFEGVKTKVKSYADSIRAQISRATAVIEEHKLAIAGIGAAMSAIAYGGYRFFSEATKDLANYQDALTVFRAKAGENADAILKAMEEAAAGTIDQTQLILNANKAMMMGINPEALPEMIRIARASARAMGTDVSYMFESIAVGTARQSKMILDNLGIIVDAEEAYKNYAKQIGKTVSRLTEEEKRQAYLNAVLEAGRKQIKLVNLDKETLNETLAKSRVSWQEFKRELAEGALPVLMIFVRGLKSITSFLKSLPEPVKALIGTIAVLGVAFTAIAGPILLQAAAFAYLANTIGGLGGVLGILGAVKAAILSFAGAIWTAMAPLLPIIAIIGAIIGAILLLQDVLVKGWEKSYLGQFVSWLLEKLPWLKPIIDGISNAFKALFSVLFTIFTKIREIWDKTIGWIIERAKGVAEFFGGIADRIQTTLGFKKVEIQPEIVKPKMDKKYYKEGSIELNVETPKIKPEMPRLRGFDLRNLITIRPLEILKEIRESRVLNAPITINISGVSDPYKVAELVEERLVRKLNAIGVY